MEQSNTYVSEDSQRGHIEVHAAGRDRNVDVFIGPAIGALDIAELCPIVPRFRAGKIGGCLFILTEGRYWLPMLNLKSKMKWKKWIGTGPVLDRPM